ncbi:glycoside hydrolase family 47 protein [Plicaturopsis crispa FD-325 SS-3]|nr:glycoside hydrolase family 47 protein [Plicaturopsis crispa FD-325 SS-3]
MAFRRSFALLVALSGTWVLPAVMAEPVQKQGLVLPPDAGAQQDAVKKIFTTSYDNYVKFALGHDDLSPIDGTFSDPLGGWGASLADALDTMWLMGLTDRFNDAVNFTSTIDFSKANTDDTVSVFETSIRYVGGYLAAYELSGQAYPILVEKAKQVADKLFYGFTPGHDIPFNQINFTDNKPSPGTTNVAQAGTLTLEYDLLSKYTGNQTYIQLAEKAVRAIIALEDPIPGLPAQGISPDSGKFVGDYVTWGGGTDSYLEYLIKYPRLTNTDDNTFVDAWALAVDTSIKTLLRTSTVGNWTYLGDFTNKTLLHVASHLECFHGGNWILGGKMLNNQTIIDIGLDLTEACWNTYASTATGIGPEVFYYISKDGNFTGDSPPTAEQLAFNEKHGFYISAADYVQRPEVLETNFYAWRATGDIKYYNRAVSAVESFNKYLAVKHGFAGLNDVNNATSTLINDQESFWFAEVLKYLWLTFDDPNKISIDEYVFNTECHPYKAPPAKPSYGSGPPKSTSSPGTFKVISGPLPAVSPYPALPNPLKDIVGSLL